LFCLLASAVLPPLLLLFLTSDFWPFSRYCVC
jgi:hypothetical protein